MYVYIVFGDRVRSDGDNIEGIFSTMERAEEYKGNLEKMTDDTEYHIEKHCVE